MKKTLTSTFGNVVSSGFGKIISMISWVYRDQNTPIYAQLGLFWIGMFLLIMMAKYLYIALIITVALGSIGIWMRHKKEQEADIEHDDDILDSHSDEGGFTMTSDDFKGASS